VVPFVIANQPEGAIPFLPLVSETPFRGQAVRLPLPAPILIKELAMPTVVGIDIPPTTILMTLGGSHAYGLATDLSDKDYLGVFVVPLERFINQAYTTAGRKQETVRFEVAKGEPVDATFHDINKFVRLALNGNPGILEIMWAPSVYSVPLGKKLRNKRQDFLHKASLCPFFGYYRAQKHRLEAGMSLHTTGGKWNPKFATHMARLMIQARHLAETGELVVDLHQTKEYSLVVDIRAGVLNQGAALAEIDRLERLASEAEKQSCLPDEPNLDSIYHDLFDCRMSF